MSVVVRKLSEQSQTNAITVCDTLTSIVSCTKNNKRALCCENKPETVELITTLLNSDGGNGACVVCLQPLVPLTTTMKKRKKNDKDLAYDSDCDSVCDSDCDDCKGKPNTVVALSCHHMYHKACLKAIHKDHMNKVMKNFADAWRTNSVIQKCRFKCFHCRKNVCLEHYYQIDKALLVAAHSVSMKRQSDKLKNKTKTKTKGKKRKSPSRSPLQSPLLVDTRVSLPERNRRRLVRANHNFPTSSSSPPSSTLVSIPETPPVPTRSLTEGLATLRRHAVDNHQQTRMLRRQESFWDATTSNSSSSSSSSDEEPVWPNMTLDDVLI